MKMTIEVMPQLTIAFIRNKGPYGIEVNETMEKLKAWAREYGLLDQESIILGIAQDDQAVTKAEDCRYDACLVIAADYTICGSHVQRGEIAAGRYAVFEIEHTAEALQNAWLNTFRVVGELGQALDLSRPVIERYAAQLIREHRCELCVPIR